MEGTGLRKATMPGDPHAEYSGLLNAEQEHLTRLERQHRTLGNVQLLLAGAAITLAVVALSVRSVSLLWILVPGSAFVSLSVIHARVAGALRTCSRVVQFCEAGLARLENRWAGRAESGEQFLDAAHPYARDLDVFGRGSLFELLCTARTGAGEATLAQWLLEPASPQTVKARQAAVAELRNRLDLRKDLAILGEDVRSGVKPEALAAWGDSEVVLQPGFARMVAYGFPVLWLASIGVALALGIVLPCLAISMVTFSVWSAFRRRATEIASHAEQACEHLALLAGVLERLGREPFSAPMLVELQTGLKTGWLAASRSIRQLSKLIDRVESRHHMFLRVIDPFLLRTLRMAFSLEAWRRRHGHDIRGWLSSVGTIEALTALAGYAYEHPADVFPELIEDTPCFDAEGFAHPLIPERHAVRNDLRLDRNSQLVIISGPNMAGKSTFVRAVGINAVLAQCGAPVRARRLHLSPLQVTASICVLDSLQGGISRFYAEILRLKLIADLVTGPLPVLFLMDELLQGTNSHDRRVGAEAVVQNLVRQGAIGLVTTHDMALTQIADGLGSSAANYHFEDRLENGRLIFDYRLSPGIVRTSNAVELMRSVGFKI